MRAPKIWQEIMLDETCGAFTCSGKTNLRLFLKTKRGQINLDAIYLDEKTRQDGVYHVFFTKIVDGPDKKEIE